ncbi:MAG: 2'-5' RNA ligase family protein [Alphaproteobacteria bacterium]
MKTTKEIGMVIRLPEEIIQEAEKIQLLLKKNFENNKFEILEPENIFHITLFQINIEEDKLEILDRIVEEISKNQESFEIILDPHLEDTQKRIFWNSTALKFNSSFRNLHCRVVDSAVELKAELPMKQFRDKNYNEEEKICLQKYGMPKHPFANLNPHITIFYNSEKDRYNVEENFIKIRDVMKDIEIPKLKFNLKEISIVELGEEGNIINILNTFNVKNISKDIKV